MDITGVKGQSPRRCIATLHVYKRIIFFITNILYSCTVQKLSFNNYLIVICLYAVVCVG